jgi:multiple sugar transport system substrate-binding protein
MIPFDGDLLHLFYNKEILDYYNFQPPRTWQEYNDIAEQVHNKVFPPTNKTLIGSCMGRVPQCAGPYWAVQVLSSMTQTKGSSEGSLFDTKDMTPLTSDALVETLKIFERQLKYGHPDEFDECMISMDNEECVLSLFWGNTFLQADEIRGKLGIDKVPGSQKVLDRETGKLVTCNKDICPNAVYYDDIGFVNYAPYAAFGGWSGAVSLRGCCFVSCKIIPYDLIFLIHHHILLLLLSGQWEYLRREEEASDGVLDIFSQQRGITQVGHSQSRISGSQCWV